MKSTVRARRNTLGVPKTRDFRLARLKSFQSKRVRAGRILNPTVPQAHGSFVENELVTILGRRITANCDDRGLELEFTVGDQGTVHGLDRKVVWHQSRWWRRQRRNDGDFGLLRRFGGGCRLARPGAQREHQDYVRQYAAPVTIV